MNTERIEALSCIKSEIKELATDLRENKRWKTRESRRCRHLLIAYGLLRGLRYEQIERPREGNEPNWLTVQEVKDACPA